MMASTIIPACKHMLSQNLSGWTVLAQRLSFIRSISSARNKELPVITKIKPEEREGVAPHAIGYKKIKAKFLLQGVDLNKYTHVPIPYPKTGGRSWSGRVFNKRIGGGHKQRYRMVDFTRNPISETEPLVEKVLEVRYDPLRSADIALVCKDNHKRWIIAGSTMKKGDIIKSCGEIPTLPVMAKEGDAHPVGALPIGSVVYNIEKFERHGGVVARAGGCSGSILKKIGDNVIIKMPSNQEISISKYCMATVGRVSNIEKQPIGSAQRHRWFGVRPASGLYQKKSGYHGRKIKAPKKLITYELHTKTKISDMFDS
ncbi:54S ribosomal protein L2 mitochondrial [Mactra antiquata]